MNAPTNIAMIKIIFKFDVGVGIIGLQFPLLSGSGL